LAFQGVTAEGAEVLNERGNRFPVVTELQIAMLVEMAASLRFWPFKDLFRAGTFEGSHGLFFQRLDGN
jgi:hypothetical protein